MNKLNNIIMCDVKLQPKLLLIDWNSATMCVNVKFGLIPITLYTHVYHLQEMIYKN